MDWSILDVMPDAVLLVDERGFIVFANQRTEAVFGHPRDQLVGGPLGVLLPGRFRRAHQAHTQGFQRDRRARPMDTGRPLFGLHRDGREIPVDVALRSIEHEGQHLTCAAIRDLTGHRQLEARARIGDELEAVLTGVAEAVVVVGLDGRVVRLNPAAERLTGCSGLEPVGSPVDDALGLFDETTGEAASLPVQELLRDGTSTPFVALYRLDSRDGEARPVALRATVVLDVRGVPAGLALVLRDLSEERARDAALRNSEARFRGLFEHMRHAVALHELLDEDPPDYVFLQVNESFEKHTGLDGVVGRRASEVMPDLLEADRWIVEIYAKVATTGNPAQFERHVATLSKWFEVSVYSPSRGFFVTVFDDVTARHEEAAALVAAEAAAVASQAQLEAVLTNAPDFVINVDRGGVIQYINRVLPQFVREDVIGANWLSFVPVDQHAFVSERFEAVLRDARSQHYESTVSGPDGGLLWFSTHLGPIVEGDDVVGAIIIGRDITEQRLAEARLQASDRMSSVGMLAAGVAHELNNPLAAVMANVELAIEDLTGIAQRTRAVEQIEEELQDALEGAERMRLVVRDLAVFSRANDESGRSSSPIEVLESTLRMAANEVRHRARVVTDFLPTPRVDVDASRLGQVFLNLVVNAAHAIPLGRAGDNEIRVATRVDPHGDVLVEIADTGAGMSEDVQRELFTPFFTTKPVGHGTGLGLSICERIVTRAGGAIEVESELGVGSLFRVRLPPAKAGRPASVAAPSPGPDRAPRGRVLVVDDEAALGRAVHRILGAAHDVTVVSSAAAAMERFAADAPFDVILCDLMMPDVTGIELHADTRARSPEVATRFVFMTGGAFTAGAHEFLEQVDNPCVRKPFEPRELRALVDGLVRARRSL